MDKESKKLRAVYIGRDSTFGKGPISVSVVSPEQTASPLHTAYGDIEAKLGPLFRLLIDSAISIGSLASSPAYCLTFSASATQALANGELVKSVRDGGLRAWASDPTNGRIVEQGILRPARPGVGLLGVGWQIAAAVTAQKYLVNINRQLAFLKAEIDCIRSELKAQNLATLVGALDYLRGHVDVIRAKLLHERDATLMAQQIQSINLDCSKVAAIAKQTLETLGSIKPDFQYDSDGLMRAESKKDFDHYLDEAEEAGRTLILSLVTRVLALELALILDPASNLALSQFAGIAREVELAEDLLRNADDRLSTETRNQRQNCSDRLEAGRLRVQSAKKQSGLLSSFELLLAEWEVRTVTKALNAAKENEKACAKLRGLMTDSLSEVKTALEALNGLVNRRAQPRSLKVVVQLDGKHTRILQLIEA